MTPAAIQSEVRSLTRQLKVLRQKLRKRLRGSPAQVFRGPTRKQAKKAKRETRRQETARIREARMKIAIGRCEARMEGYPQDRCLVISPLHMHHTLGGSGRRRERQTVENVRMYCWKHHREAHHLERARIEGKGRT